MDDRGFIRQFDSDEAARAAGFRAKLSQAQAEELEQLAPHERAAWDQSCQLAGDLLPIPKPVSRREFNERAHKRQPGAGARVGGTFKTRR